MQQPLRLAKWAPPRWGVDARPGNLRLLFAIATLLLPTLLFCNVSTTSGQQLPGREIVFPKVIRWTKQRGVSRYRLQIAGDEHFQNVFFDAQVAGEQYVVGDLSAGYYYWKVAPVGSYSVFSPPLRFFLSGGVVTRVQLPGRGTGVRSSAIVSSKVP